MLEQERAFTVTGKVGKEYDTVLLVLLLIFQHFLILFFSQDTVQPVIIKEEGLEAFADQASSDSGQNRDDPGQDDDDDPGRLCAATAEFSAEEIHHIMNNIVVHEQYC